MMKNIRALACVALLACGATGAFAARGGGLAIGGEGALYVAGSGGLPMSAMLLVHLPQFPAMIGIGLSSAPAVGLTVDWWAAHGNLGSIFSWYLGVGGYVSVDFGASASISAGGRLPIGLQAWPVGQVLEIFVELAPAVGIILVPTGFDWHLQGAVGLRFWL
jgi:hypothetical protein